MKILEAAGEGEEGAGRELLATGISQCGAEHRDGAARDFGEAGGWVD